ncbi:uncharacterized protein LOC135484602 [Lineus longissimus]|uniref:uncharacterized protein LOC135484602 n=1 Tax=Lineus longissimus TaxID=88925 RepID=UPI00315DCA05
MNGKLTSLKGGINWPKTVTQGTTSPIGINKSTHVDYEKNITNTFPLDGALQLKGKIGKIHRARELSQKHRVVFMDLLSKFLQLAEELKLIYFIYGGSLLGSWRHHGFIPYDDDLDIIVNNSQKAELLKAITKLNPDYVGGDGRPVIKFWSKNSTVAIKGMLHHWPFIDISFFKETKTYVWDTMIPNVNHNKVDVFPLHKRPFEGVMVNAPQNSAKMLKRLYGSRSAAICKTLHFSHREEKDIGKSHVHDKLCRTFRGVYPFVERRFLKGEMEEKLMLGDRVVHTKMVDEPKYGWTPIYSY